jgi:hypothetical protein
MKITETRDLICNGAFHKTRSWRRACADTNAAISSTGWPHGSRKFVIQPIVHGNGVVPIKLPCIKELRRRHWKVEHLPEIDPGILASGDLDAVLETSEGWIAFEWETGNISSSHRALNKLLLALYQGRLKGGILAVPSARLYRFLTDRVGNITELRPYFPLWQAIPIRNGCLRIVVVEQDSENLRVTKIPKGTDGRARK